MKFRGHSALLIAGLCAGGMVALVPAAHAEDVRTSAPCQAERLSWPAHLQRAEGELVPPPDRGEVTAGDPTGHWLGGNFQAGYPQGPEVRPVVWHNGTPSFITTPFEEAWITGINRDGVAVGYGYYSAFPGSFVPFAFVDGWYVILELPDGIPTGGGQPTGISSNGTVSGWVTDGTTRRAVTWKIDAPDQVNILTLPSRTKNSTAVDISPAGRVAVAADMRNGDVRSFLFTKTEKRSQLHGVEDGVDVKVTAIADGWAVATPQRTDAEHEVVRFNLRDDTAEVIDFGEYYTFTGAVNNDGVLGGGHGAFGGVLYSDHLIELDEPQGDGAWIHTISNAGRPAGVTSDVGGPGFHEPLRWTGDCT